MFVRTCLLLVLGFFVGACDSSGGGAADAVPDRTTGDVVSDGYRAEVLVGDTTVEDLRPEELPPADLPPEIPESEVDPDPGCNGDFCAAGPEHSPDPAAWGPFPVGGLTTTVELVDWEGHPRTIRVEIWYPTTDVYADGPFEDIDLYADAPEEYKEILAPYANEIPSIPVQVSRDTPMRRGDGPYPVVLFSHGAYGVRFQSVFFTVPLASHGYIVVSMDHTGNVLYDMFGPAGFNEDGLVHSALNRPLDSVATLDEILARNETPGDLLEGMIRPDAIGMSGHSFGGYTSFHMGFSDPRIKAIVPQAPATGMLPIMGFNFADFQIPVMVQADALDGTLPPETEMRPAYEGVPPPKFWFYLTTGGHFTYSNICQLDLLHIAEDLGIDGADNALDDGCAEYNIPVEEAHPMINQFAIGFFNYYLRGSTGSLQYFDAAAAEVYSDALEYEFEM